MNLDEVVEKYVKLRDRKAALKKKHAEELKPYDDKMALIEAAILKLFQKTGQKSARTDHGTPYISERSNVKLEDRDAFFEFVFANKATEFLPNSVAKPAVTSYIEEHEDLPPGLSMSTELTINVRTSK